MEQTIFGASGTVRASGLSRFNRLRRLDPDVQFKLTINAVNAFMVPVMPPDIAQIKETQTEAPGLLCLRQSDQEIGNLLVLVIQPGAVTITCLTDLEGAAGNRNAHPSQRQCFPGHFSALRWPRHFFPRASLSSSACMLISAYIFFRRRLLRRAIDSLDQLLFRLRSSRAFIWLIIEASMPPYWIAICRMTQCSFHVPGITRVQERRLPPREG